MNSITPIDSSITSIVEEVKTFASKMKFNIICEFEVSANANESIPWDQIKFPGIYFIEIKNCNSFNDFKAWASDFTEKWMDEKYLRKFVANPKKGRINQHKELSDWIPLYLGKSKNISKRVFEHVFLGLDKPTFALKLASRSNLNNHRFRLSCIEVRVENYDTIMPILEKSLRNRLNPIIGRQ